MPALIPPTLPSHREFGFSSLKPAAAPELVLKQPTTYVQSRLLSAILVQELLVIEDSVHSVLEQLLEQFDQVDTGGVGSRTRPSV